MSEIGTAGSPNFGQLTEGKFYINDDRVVQLESQESVK
jgi:hypothetical protein